MIREERCLTLFSLAESSNMRSNGFFIGSIPSTNTCHHTQTRTLYLHETITNIRKVSDQMLTWLTEGCPVVFLFEVVSRPHREEKRLRRLLKLRGTAWFRFFKLLSVRADTCDGENVKVWRCSSSCFFNVLYYIYITWAYFFLEFAFIMF